jgi:hypothetical protein
LRIGLPIPERAGREPPRERAPALRRRCLRSALGGERLEPVGDDLDGPSSSAVRGLPLAALEPSLDVDEAVFAEVLDGIVGKLAEDRVVELGVALAVRGDSDGRDVRAPPEPSPTKTGQSGVLSSTSTSKWTTACY